MSSLTSSRLPGWTSSNSVSSASAAILVITAAAVLIHITTVALLAVLALIAIAAYRPAASVAAIPAVVGFVFEPVHIRSLEFSPQEVLLVTTVAGTALHMLWIAWQDQSLSRLKSIVRFAQDRRTLFDLAALLMIVAGAVSLVTLAMPAYRHESLRDFRWVIVEPLVFYVLALWFIRDRATRRLTVILFVAGGVLVAMTGVVGYVTGHGLAVEGVTRVSGVYPQPNALALFLERPFLLAVGLAAAFRANLRWTWLGAAGLIGIVLVMTFSRGAVLAAGVAIVVILILGHRRRLAALAIAAGVGLGAILAITASARIDNLFSGGSGSLRIDLWQSSIQMIRDHPIFGIGLDQFLYVYAPRYIKPQAWSERFTSHPHDIILDIWLRLGIMGLVLALAYLAGFVWMTVRLVRRKRALGLAASGAVLVGMLHGLVDNGYFLPDLALIFWFMTALIVVEAQDDTPEAARQS